MKAAFFDLDGTLQDSEIVWVAATRDYVRDHGYPMTDEEALNIVYGRAWGDIRDDLAALSPELSAMDATTMANETRRFFHARLKASPDISIPGSVSLLKRLAGSLTVAIVSGSPRSDVANAVQLCGIAKETAFVLGGEDYAHGKPAPDGYLLAAQRFGVTPAQCIVLEDSTAGVRSGLAAGMKVVGIDRGTVIQQAFTGCFITVHDLAEFTRR